MHLRRSTRSENYTAPFSVALFEKNQTDGLGCDVEIVDVDVAAAGGEQAHLRAYPAAHAGGERLAHDDVVPLIAAE